MEKLKKNILVFALGVSGLLLTLAGFGLIQLSSPLILYSGIGLLILTVFMYFFG